MSTVALPKGAWLPDRNGILHFHRDQPAPTWQDTRRTACGSLTGVHHHRANKQPLCGLCKATEQQYHRERKRAKKGDA